MSNLPVIYKYEVCFSGDITCTSINFFSPKIDFKKGDLICLEGREWEQVKRYLNTVCIENEFEIISIIWSATPPDFETHEPYTLPVLVGELNVIHVSQR